MARVLILGAGMVGSVMALDMARWGVRAGGEGTAGWDVHLVDANAGALSAAAEKIRRLTGRAIVTSVADLKDAKRVAALVRGEKKLVRGEKKNGGAADLVLGALSSAVAHRAMRAVISALPTGGVMSDIAFVPEDSAELDALARRRGVTVVCDCGVAPGMSHILSAYAAGLLDVCAKVEIMVGGLPRVRSWPFEYKAAFSPMDVLEEYTRPVRLVRGGKLVHAEAMSEAELVDLPGVGTLEAFLTDGLRSLAEKPIAPEMVEKTLRYPGHIELMKVLRATGLMGTEAVAVRDELGKQVKVVPREVLAKLMFPHWTYEPGEEDLTVMRVRAVGERKGQPAEVSFDLLDFFDRATACTSMSRTTALPCTIVGRMLVEGVGGAKKRVLPLRPGVHAPERVGEHPAAVKRLLAELEASGVRYVRSEKGRGDRAEV